MSQNYQPPGGAPGQQNLQPHRGGLVLTLGILGIAANFCGIPGILAWIFGASDLKQMKAGTMDREGEGPDQGGLHLWNHWHLLAGRCCCNLRGFLCPAYWCRSNRTQYVILRLLGRVPWVALRRPMETTVGATRNSASLANLNLDLYATCDSQDHAAFFFTRT